MMECTAAQPEPSFQTRAEDWKEGSLVIRSDLACKSSCQCKVSVTHEASTRLFQIWVGWC